MEFLSTLSLRRATPEKSESLTTYLISIHALLAESDSRTKAIPAKVGYFYPRSPCGERPSSTVIVILRKNFYPRSPCGERLYDTYAKVLRVNISIHALLAESDCTMTIIICIASKFLSTLSLRRATAFIHSKHS